MHSIIRVLLFALLALVLHVLVTPMPLPLLRAVDYQQQNTPSRVGTVKLYRIRHTTMIQESTHTELETTVRQTASSPTETSGLDARTDETNLFTSLFRAFDAAQRYSMRFQSLSAQSASRQEDNTAFQQQCASELTGFQTSMRSFYTVLADMASDKGLDKGLANYDSKNELETMLKDIVNMNKYVMNDVTALVYTIPELGPILGPIVYEIKCIIDSLLDLTENLTDAVLNAIQPLLSVLAGQAGDATCTLGVEVGGICA